MSKAQRRLAKRKARRRARSRERRSRVALLVRLLVAAGATVNNPGLVALACLCLALACLAGCQAPQGSGAIARAGRAGDGVSDAIAAVKADIASAERGIVQARPYATPPGPAILDGARDDLAAATLAANDAKADLGKVKTELANAEHDADAQEKRYAALEARWYVRWGRRAEWAFWIAVGGWAVLGVAAAFLGAGNPVGWAFTASRTVFNAIPFAGPFAWLRDSIAKRKGKP